MIVTRGFGNNSLVVTRGFGTIGPIVEAIIKILPDFITRRESFMNITRHLSISRVVSRVSISKIVRREDD